MTRAAVALAASEYYVTLQDFIGTSSESPDEEQQH